MSQIFHLGCGREISKISTVLLGEERVGTQVTTGSGIYSLQVGPVLDIVEPLVCVLGFLQRTMWQMGSRLLRNWMQSDYVAIDGFGTSKH